MAGQRPSLDHCASRVPGSARGAWVDAQSPGTAGKGPGEPQRRISDTWRLGAQTGSEHAISAQECCTLGSTAQGGALRPVSRGRGLGTRFRRLQRAWQPSTSGSRRDAGIHCTLPPRRGAVWRLHRQAPRPPHSRPCSATQTLPSNATSSPTRRSRSPAPKAPAAAASSLPPPPMRVMPHTALSLQRPRAAQRWRCCPPRQRCLRLRRLHRCPLPRQPRCSATPATGRHRVLVLRWTPRSQSEGCSSCWERCGGCAGCTRTLIDSLLHTSCGGCYPLA